MRDNTWTIRQMFKWKYKEKFGEEYSDDKKGIELKLIKNLITLYGFDVVFLAINYFFQSIPKQNAHILLFVSKKFFPREFEKLINNKDIVYYIRHINEFVGTKVEELLDEYIDYTSAITPSDTEIARKKEILKELKDIKDKCSPPTLNLEQLVQ